MKIRLALGTLALVLVLPVLAAAHCQIPCGIYDDAARIAQMREDATTIEKAMQQMAQLNGKTDVQSTNQLVRWITNKEEHASRVITTVSEYFLTQKVKPVAADAEGYQDYLKSLADHHAVMTAAMKCKQNTDLSHVENLRKAIDALAAHYSTEGHEH
jgi:nickel superoxide dismutase